LIDGREPASHDAPPRVLRNLAAGQEGGGPLRYPWQAAAPWERNRSRFVK
jgi:hypothetical protein